jgi:hypothetical protein
MAESPIKVLPTLAERYNVAASIVSGLATLQLSRKAER